MASNSSGGPSSSSSGSAESYDVFLSFRGKDTRLNFTSHLHKALCHGSIKTFIDYELERGDEISPALTGAIQRSKISVVIFSKDYASSRWCLDGLLTILECRRTSGQRIIPVFYDIDPSIVRKQSNSYAKSFKSHEERFQGKLQKWREALTEVSNLSGYQVHRSGTGRTEADLVNEIVDDVMRHLSGLHMQCKKTKGLVGMERHVREVEGMLDVDSGDVPTVGIWGMGGIGKTTIARVVYDKLCSRFESHLFVGNVAEKENRCGFEDLQMDLYSKLTSMKRRRIDTLHEVSLSFVQHRLRGKKVLLVLDDVGHIEQLEALIKGREIFGSGSRIILTGRDKQVLVNGDADEIYEVRPMHEEEALHLFSLWAFKQSHPPQDHLELSNMIVNYANGLPLAVKLLGSSLYKKSYSIWKSALYKLQEVPPDDVIGKLRISYDALDDTQKEIFLDISCNLKGMQTDTVRNILRKKYGSSLDCNIEVLKDRCHIYDYGPLHDLLTEMGCQIDGQEAKEPEMRRRLWHPADICQELAKNKVGSSRVRDLFVSFLPSIFYQEEEKKMEVELLSLDVSQLRETKVTLDPAVFKRMPKLRLLRFYNGLNYSNNYAPALYLPNGLKMLPNKLMFLHWDYYPLKSLPSACRWAHNLVELHMPNSKIKKLSFGNQILPNLKSIDLSGSKELTEIADLSQTPNIERISLSYCKRLIRVASSTFLKQLKELCMPSCYGLRDFSVVGSISWLDLFGVRGKDLPKKIEYIDVKSSSDEDGELVGESNNCSGCRSPSPDELAKLIHSVVSLSSLTFLFLDDSPIETLPACTINLTQLHTLSLRSCKYLRSLPKLPQSVKFVNASDCISLKCVSSFAHIYDSTAWYDYNFTNCLKLDQTSYSNILEAFYASVTDPNNLESFGFVGLPARSDIWRCFPYQAEGDLLALEDITTGSPTNDIDQLLVGFAFAIVICGGEYVTDEIECGVSEVVDETSENRWTQHISSTSTFGEFVQLGSMLNRGSGHDHSFKFQFRLQFDKKNPSASVVKKCGVKPLYLPYSQVRQFWDEVSWILDEGDLEPHWVQFCAA